MKQTPKAIPSCDFCGRPKTKIPNQNGPRELEMDADGFWVCNECKIRLVSKPIGSTEEIELDEKLGVLVGQSAGAICYTLNLPYAPPYQKIIDAASRIAYDEDRYMSTWSFVTQWIDGTTVWQSADQCAKALVSTDGKVQIETMA
jgi:hypothetical protein